MGYDFTNEFHYKGQYKQNSFIYFKQATPFPTCSNPPLPRGGHVNSKNHPSEHHVNKPACVSGHTRSTALLRIRPCGTGPYTRESREFPELSPCSHTCPLGTVSVVRKPVRTMSPGSAATLLHTYWRGLIGQRAITTSPRSG